MVGLLLPVLAALGAAQEILLVVVQPVPEIHHLRPQAKETTVEHLGLVVIIMAQEVVEGHLLLAQMELAQLVAMAVTELLRLFLDHR